MRLNVDPSWFDFFKEESEKAYFHQLIATLRKERKHFHVYPEKGDTFKAFLLTPLDKVKVVIIGQDPYHQPKQAEGLAFSVQKGVACPPSLVNIFKELARDCATHIPNHGSLIEWAQQGVLLLNSALTVRASSPMSHAAMWSTFTHNALQYLTRHQKKCVFLLWGSAARKKIEEIQREEGHKTIATTHPSPLSAYRGFLGSGCFSRVNCALEEMGIAPINWQISNTASHNVP